MASSSSVVNDLDEQHTAWKGVEDPLGDPFSGVFGSDIPGFSEETARTPGEKIRRSASRSRARSPSPPPRTPARQIRRKGKRGPPTLAEVNRVLGALSTDIDTGRRVVAKLQDDLVSANRPQPHIGLGGVHHNPTQAPTDTGPRPGIPSVPRRELREPHPVTQGTYKIYDVANPPKRSDFLEQALFGSLQVEPRLASQSEWQKMPGYEATPVPPPPSSKTPFGKYVEPRRPVAAFALSPSGPIQGSDEPGLAALAWSQTPVADLTKHFSLTGH